MQEHCLLKDESLITQSKNGIVSLTNYRIRYRAMRFGKSHVISMMLEKVSSIETRYRSYLLVFLLGILALILGIVAGAENEGDLMLLAFCVGGVLLLFYFLTRRHVISIKSDGGTSIDFQIKSMRQEAVLKFINQIEKAKRDSN